MAIKIAYCIQKGGQGKTTSSVVMAEILSKSGYKVLLLDLDGQGNATQMVSGKSIYVYEGKTIYEAMVERDPIPYLMPAGENLYFMAADDMMSLFSKHIYTSGIKHPASVLKKTMKAVENEFDFVIMDCPPSLGDIVSNAVIYADYIITPMDAGAFSMDGLDRFVDFVSAANSAGHTKAELLGILFTLRDGRSKHERKVVEAIHQKYPGLPFKSEIRRRAKIKEAAMSGVSLVSKADADVYADYLNFVEEVIDRVKRRKST